MLPLLRAGTLEEDLCRIYSAEILLALIHLHERRIIFRDLKPDNVVISEEPWAMRSEVASSVPRFVSCAHSRLGAPHLVD